MMDSPYILEIEGLEKRFGDRTALDNVDLHVESGSVYAVLGPNGAGKTTLLRIINGILAKDRGAVRVFGKDASLETAMNIGYLPEERGLYDSMTVASQIEYFGVLKGASRKDVRETMEEYLELFNLSESKGRKIKELSKGNQQKVQIICAIVHDPELVILDEPFSGFDPINGQLLQQLVERLRQKGKTVLLSSHNMHAVEEMCDHIALIDKGRVLVEGSLADIRDANKSGEFIITLDSPVSEKILHPESTQDSDALFEWIMPLESNVRYRGFSYRILKRDGVSNLSLVERLSEGNGLLRFEEALPSLADIFIKYTTQNQS